MSTPVLLSILVVQSLATFPTHLAAANLLTRFSNPQKQTQKRRQTRGSANETASKSEMAWIASLLSVSLILGTALSMPHSRSFLHRFLSFYPWLLIFRILDIQISIGDKLATLSSSEYLRFFVARRLPSHALPDAKAKFSNFIPTKSDSYLVIVGHSLLQYAILFVLERIFSRITVPADAVNSPFLNIFNLKHLAIYYAYSVAVYCLVSFNYNLVFRLFLSVLIGRVPVPPVFCMPFVSRSCKEFWSVR